MQARQNKNYLYFQTLLSRLSEQYRELKQFPILLSYIKDLRLLDSMRRKFYYAIAIEHPVIQLPYLDNACQSFAKSHIIVFDFKHISKAFGAVFFPEVFIALPIEEFFDQFLID